MSSWQAVLDAVSNEFKDLGDLPSAVTVVVRLAMAGALGGILGYEREAKGKDAGLRTHMLVALGAAVFVLVPQEMDRANDDIFRVIQGLVAGIGFLGAGAIVKGRPGEGIEGLTTAASIWMAAAIGMTAGFGRQLTAIISTLLALFVLTVMCNGAGWLHRRRNSKADGPSDCDANSGRRS